MKSDWDWIHLDDTPQPVINTPWGMVALARGCGPEAVRARGSLLELYKGSIYFYTLGMVRNRERAAELSQDFTVPFLEGRLFSLADQARGSFGTYLKVWVKNHVRTSQKRERVRRAERLDGVEIASEGESPEEDLDRRMTLAEVSEALRRARAKSFHGAEAMRVFDAWHLQRPPEDRRTQAELAREMGISPRRFQVQLSLAREAVRYHLLQILSIGTSSVDQLQEELGRVRQTLRGPAGDRLQRTWSRRKA